MQNKTEAMLPKLHVISVSYKKFGELRVFVQSWINQSNSNWQLTVIHDGPNQEFFSVMEEFKKNSANIEYFATNKRFNDFGHSLRDLGLKNIKGDYVLLTNSDNYFIPKTMEYVNDILKFNQPDIIIYDMVHSHNKPGGRNLPSYSFFETRFERLSIDISCAIVRSDLANKVGFRDKTHDGDATFFEDLMKINYPNRLNVIKIPRVLFVHN